MQYINFNQTLAKPRPSRSHHEQYDDSFAVIASFEFITLQSQYHDTSPNRLCTDFYANYLHTAHPVLDGYNLTQCGAKAQPAHSGGYPLQANSILSFNARHKKRKLEYFGTPGVLLAKCMFIKLVMTNAM
jgi:hypothetical protein